MKQLQLFFTTFTSILFYIVFILYLIYPTYFREFLLSLFPMLVGVWIVGFLLTYIYYKQIQKKYNLSNAEMIIGDFFGHLLPIIISLIILYKDNRYYHIPWWSGFVYIGLFLFYLILNEISYKKFWRIYPGIPAYTIILGMGSTLVLYIAML